MRRECGYWTITALGPTGCALKRGHGGEHRCNTKLRIGQPVQFSGFGIGKMRLHATKGLRPVAQKGE